MTFFEFYAVFGVPLMLLAGCAGLAYYATHTRN